ncbi:hypothetical protein C446_04415 [Halobiforma nitratireducens JCM 10879]|uniref:Uncharacterized protein n=1 Tax=Halobiforma nitratireducens JCM 10879 TaxID=1227454 RepID=M0M934_9EURY|nr:hypothetical protein C446_04415 [Halobiforma nitratireducens JCM 10879]
MDGYDRPSASKGTETDPYDRRRGESGSSGCVLP